MFVDRAKIRVRAGKGGDGAVSFRREKYEPRGGPDGGDGGPGGSVILRAVTGEQSLVDYRFQQHITAKNGVPGRGKKCYGAHGEDTIANVPLGTIVRDLETGEFLADLVHQGDEYVAARGGRGGKGNIHFVTSERRAPRVSTPGKDGEEAHLLLELKTIADVGLVGYPNAGKSTLLGAVSDAHPRVGAYPFTTLHPVVGVVEFEDFFRFTIADIPGLIDGAHRNVGLGHEFLRHIERCRVLVFVLDASGSEGRWPWDDLTALQRELELHKTGLSSRVAIVAANKTDREDAQELLAELRANVPMEVLAISAQEHQNTRELVVRLRALLEELDQAAPPPDEEAG